MSYILDALRKSETERRQGQVPDLGHQVQLIHRPKRSKPSPVLWVVLALLVNAGVLTVVFWPYGESVTATASGPVSAASDEAAVQPAQAAMSGQDTAESTAALAEPEAGTPTNAVSEPALAQGAEQEQVRPDRQRPTIIEPRTSPKQDNPILPEPVSAGRVPHLVELPVSFQKSVPDLTFNSHIYSSDPFASRVMINNNYLRRGDSFSGLTVERITQDGVVLSRQGQHFRVGIVRDWVSPR
ncbi:general secretion pathway protein GspB [Marinobacter sp.]|uniref:general secretion pathway protein GspB n=1 Tax=Marinobacter sp. TaxID=50741 RepID=UPI0035C731B5|nr:general secretion pathway protein GspB [Oleiphilaceae bacterium]